MGLLDKVGLAVWLLTDRDKRLWASARTAYATGRVLGITRPWSRPVDMEAITEILELPFSQTPFAQGVISIMEGIVALADSGTSESLDAYRKLHAQALSMGCLAVACYTTYAEACLEPSEVRLATSMISV